MINISEFKDKKILVTGAAIGIGKETSILLSKLGAQVIMLDIDEDTVKKTYECLIGKGHNYFYYDLIDLEGIENKIKEIVSICGTLDGFVNCVGIRSRRSLSTITPKVLNNIMNINFGAFIELVRCITKKANFNEGLSIVAISSIASQIGGISVTAYSASKGAVDSAVRCLAKELAVKKIRVNSVVPAQINTPEYENYLKLKGENVDTALSRQYLGLGEAIDVANVIVFLLSSASRFITGAAVPVDGGFLSS